MIVIEPRGQKIMWISRKNRGDAKEEGMKKQKTKSDARP